ncbi:MAG: tetratricopeptide repeat-containing protein [Pseudomonadota bacterium]
MLAHSSPHRLDTVRALLRAGANERAWERFRDAGLDEVTDDPDVLTLHGRLLKDLAKIEVDDVDRRAGYLASADTYARAAELDRATYPLINAASLSLIGGDRNRSKTLAALTLDRLDDPRTPPDTDYYVAATRAEALLLLERIGEARTAFTDAIAAAPRAYEDHATTLRQFALILDALDLNTDWLDEVRPPVSLHFAGHMAIDPGGADDAARRIADAVGAQGAGFGYGALAAGADLLIAEALLKGGSELHIVLPGPPDAFRNRSVVTRDPAWGPRFDAVIAAADSVHALPMPPADGAWDAAIQLAGEIAMGMAAANARTIESTARQLLVLRDAEAVDRAPANHSERLAAIWRDGGQAQSVVAISGPAAPATPSELTASPFRLAACLRAELCDDAAITALLDVAEMADVLLTTEPPLVLPRWHGNTIDFSYADPMRAYRVAQRLRGLAPPATAMRISAHYGIVRRAPDPFVGGEMLIGTDGSRAAQMVSAVPTGAFYASDSFAYALLARAAEIRIELMGEFVSDTADPDVPPVSLYALHDGK